MEEVDERRGSGGAGSPRPASRAGSLTPVVSGPRPGQRPESQPGSDCSDGSEEASPEAAPEAAAAGSAAGAQEETRGCPEAVHGGRPPLAPAAAPAQPEAEEAQAARKGARVTFNASHTDYDVVLAAAEARGWRVVKNEDKAGQCHVHWIDDGAIGDWLKRIEPWMRVNHFPGMNNALARKTRLARNMSRMQRIFPKEYNFLPPTWVLPDDLGELERRIGEDSKVIYIVKPDHLCQGRGIFLTTDLDRIRQCTKEMREKDQAAVVQRYLMRPMLIDGLKFDLRLYFLVCGKPSQSGLDLRCFLFKDGLVRLCTTPYQPPTEETMKQKCMHLTNYAINKKSKNFQQNDGEDGGSTGNKRSLSWFLNYVEEEHGPKERRKLWIKMMGLCSKLLLTVQPTLEAEYSGVFPRDLSGGDMGCRCFEVLGIDVMLDSKMKPYLIEVNHLPSFTCDSPLDEDIKRRLIDQTMDLTCGSVTNSAKKAYELLVRERRGDGAGAAAAAARAPAAAQGGAAPAPDAARDPAGPDPGGPAGEQLIDLPAYKDFERAFPPPPEAAKLREQCERILGRVREVFKPVQCTGGRRREGSTSKELPAPPQRGLPPKPPANAGHAGGGAAGQDGGARRLDGARKRSGSAPERPSCALPPVAHRLAGSATPRGRARGRSLSPAPAPGARGRAPPDGGDSTPARQASSKPPRVFLPLKTVQILM